MPPFVNLPWLNSSDQFLQSMLAGGKAGLEREQMKNDLARETLRRFSFGGGGSANPLAVDAQRWREQYQQSLLDDADKRLELAEDRNRISEEQGSRYQFLQPGLGQIALGNPMTGEVQTIQEPRDTTREPTMSFPFYSGDPMVDAAMGVQPTVIRGGVSQVAPLAGQGLPQALQNSFSPYSRQSAEPAQVQEVIRLTPDGKRAIFDANTKKFLRYAD